MKSMSAAVLSLCLAFGIAAPGCVVAAVGAAAAAGYGAYKYAKGELRNTENVSLDKAWSATQAGIKDLEFRVKEQAKDALEAKLVAVKVDNKEVKIHLKAESDTVTTFSVRVGTIGDEEMSRRVMDAIRKHL